MINDPQIQRRICCSGLSLTLYREVMAHLRQIPGVEAELLPQRSQVFDYYQSQVGGLELRYAPTLETEWQTRLEQILTYYGDRYGAWQLLDDATTPSPEKVV